MEVVRQQDVKPEDASNAPLFYGGKVTRQPLIGSSKTEQYNFSIVSFYGGAKNHFHTHTSDQILFATAGEKHWHGAADGHDFAHVSLTRPDSETEMFLPEGD